MNLVKSIARAKRNSLVKLHPLGMNPITKYTWVDQKYCVMLTVIALSVVLGAIPAKTFSWSKGSNLIQSLPSKLVYMRSNKPTHILYFRRTSWRKANLLNELAIDEAERRFAENKKRPGLTDASCNRASSSARARWTNSNRCQLPHAGRVDCLESDKSNYEER